MGRKTYVFVHKTPQKRLFAGSSGRKRPLRVTKLHPSLPWPSGCPFGRSGRPDLPQGRPRALAGGREIAIGFAKLNFFFSREGKESHREGYNSYFPPSRQSPRAPLREVRAARGPKARGRPDLPKGQPEGQGREGCSFVTRRGRFRPELPANKRFCGVLCTNT